MLMSGAITRPLPHSLTIPYRHQATLLPRHLTTPTAHRDVERVHVEPIPTPREGTPACAPKFDGAASIPQHVAIIMDGNSRWARQRSLPAFSGHQRGVDALRSMVYACRARGIPCLTVFALSTENLSRDSDELAFLLRLIEQVLEQEIEELNAGGVRMKFIGARDKLPKSLLHCLEKVEAATADNADLVLTVALSYSGRQDITRAVHELCGRVAAGKLMPEEITSEVVAASLALSHLGSFQQADLIIRSGGEKRLSNFLLWESAYSELYFSDVFWPDFGEKEFSAALSEFARRERRFGRR